MLTFVLILASVAGPDFGGAHLAPICQALLSLRN